MAVTDIECKTNRCFSQKKKKLTKKILLKWMQWYIRKE